MLPFQRALLRLHDQFRNCTATQIKWNLWVKSTYSCIEI